MSTLKRTAIALAAALSLNAASALAIGDIRLQNGSSQIVHPYFKSNCWDPAFTSAGPGEWVFFGGVLGGTGFTWNDFYGLLDPKCRNPVVKVTYTLGGEAPPHETVVERTVVLHYDAMENTRITLGNEVVVKGVTTE